MNACSLPAEQQRVRAAEFDALFARSLVRVERLGVTAIRLTLGGGRDLPGRVGDLVNRESGCCSFFTFTVSQRDEPAGRIEVVLTVAVPGEYSHVLEALVSASGSQRRESPPEPVG